MSQEPRSAEFREIYRRIQVAVFMGHTGIDIGDEVMISPRVT